MTRREQRILNLISLKPHGGLTPISELRAIVGRAMTKDEFDAAVIALADAGKIALHHHDYPAGLTDAEKAVMIREITNITWAGKNVARESYVIGAGLR